MASADLLIRIVTDTKRATGDLDETASRLGKFQGALSRAAAPAAAVVAGLGAIGAASVKSASNLQQSMGAIDAVFGASAGQVKSWAKNAATSAGLAASEYGNLATVIGAQLKNMGVPMAEVAGRTNELVHLGADLAATYGGTTKEAVEALSSALRGETDPIERYGVSIKQADVAARLAATGQDKLTGAAGKQAKTAALLSLITEQTADAQGMFAKESNSAAGASQIAAAQFENAKARLGQALLPAVVATATALADLAGWVEKNSTTAQVLAGVIGGIAVAVLAVNAALKVYQAGLIVVGAIQKATWLTSPIMLVVAAVALVAAGIVTLWKHSATFRSIVLGVWNAVRSGAVAMGSAIRSAWNTTTNLIRSTVRAAGSVVTGVWSTIREGWATATGAIRERANNVREGIASAFRAAREVASSVFTAIRTAWATATGAIRERAGDIREGIAGAFRAAREVASAVMLAIRTAWSNAVSALRGVAESLNLTGPFTAVKNAVESAISAVKSLIGWIKSIKIPKINLPGLGKALPGPVTYGVRAVTDTPTVARTGGLSPRRTTTATDGGGIHITINGAIDPEATARQIRRILAGHDRRVGLAS